MGTYGNFDKNKCMHFLIKEETKLINVMKFGKKLM